MLVHMSLNAGETTTPEPILRYWCAIHSRALVSYEVLEDGLVEVTYIGASGLTTTTNVNLKPLARDYFLSNANRYVKVTIEEEDD